MTPMERIQDFLGRRRFAIVGVSRRSNDFSRALFREFRDRGYDPVPVNPDAVEIEGRPCFPRVGAIEPPVDGVLFMTPPAMTAKLIQDCPGIRSMWMYRDPGPEAMRFCEANGIAAIAGECPFMFLPGEAWYHRLHGFVRKIGGTYPK